MDAPLEIYSQFLPTQALKLEIEKGIILDIGTTVRIQMNDTVSEQLTEIQQSDWLVTVV